MFLGELFTGHGHHFLVAPHVDRHHVKTRLESLCYTLDRHVVLPQLVTVGTAGLPEIQDQAFPIGRCFVDIFRKIQETLLEPRRVGGIFRPQELPFGRLVPGHRLGGKQRQGDQRADQQARQFEGLHGVLLRAHVIVIRPEPL